MKRKFLMGLCMMVLFMFVLNGNTAFAAKKSKALTPKEMEKQAGNFLQIGEDEANANSNMSDVTEAVTDSFLGLGQILVIFGAIIMVGCVLVMGIKYMTSPPDKQAELKQRLIYLVVAGIVIFGAYGIWTGVLDIVSEFD